MNNPFFSVRDDPDFLERRNLSVNTAVLKQLQISSGSYALGCVLPAYHSSHSNNDVSSGGERPINSYISSCLNASVGCHISADYTALLQYYILVTADISLYHISFSDHQIMPGEDRCPKKPVAAGLLSSHNLQILH